jgi:hypothetical protein
VATVMLAWELGGGLGHLMQLRPLAIALASRGHRVYAVLKNVARAEQVFGRGTVSVLQAPIGTCPPEHHIAVQSTFAQLLHDVAFGHGPSLSAAVEAWRTLLALVRPDLVIFDHSPTALLAAHGLPLKRVVVGSGFCCPPDVTPLPNLRPWRTGDPARLLEHEHETLARMNAVVLDSGAAPLDRATQLYGDVDDTFLLTFREFDHYPARPPRAPYRGAWTKPEGKPPVWPDGVGKRLYAYLKHFPALEALLSFLRDSRLPTLVLCDGIPVDVQRRYASGRLRFEQERLDMQAVARTCDVAVLNAGHGTTAAVLLAGKPILQIPVFLEQVMLARAINPIGATLNASLKDAGQIVSRLRRLLTEVSFTAAAQAFAGQYADYDPVAEHERMLVRLDELLGAQAVDAPAVASGVGSQQLGCAAKPNGML